MPRKKCQCGHEPTYCLPGEKNRKWCTNCKPENAVYGLNVKKCECGKHSPSFSLPGEKNRLWCKDCKPINAINSKCKTCICGKSQPLFNLPEETNPIWCAECKQENAINVRDKKCECGKHIPYFNLPGEINPIWCAECKQENAINIRDKKCECGKHSPSFSLLGEKNRLWCKDCKPNDAINSKYKICECRESRPLFNLPGKIGAKWCIKCRPIDSINVNGKLCKFCNLKLVRNPKYKDYCPRCFIHLFPDNQISTNYKVKENHIFDAVLKFFPNTTLIRDKQVGACSKRRPDLMIDLGSHWICAENDENCHKTYDDSCENKRIMELYTDMANRPMILIRFNCDKYSQEESLFKSCRKTGISIIRSKKKFEERISKFAELLNKYINSEPPEKAITIEYLYYD